MRFELFLTYRKMVTFWTYADKSGTTLRQGFTAVVKSYGQIYKPFNKHIHDYKNIENKAASKQTTRE